MWLLGRAAIGIGTEAVDFNGQSVLVTGGAGFIGSHLVETLLQLGAGVSVLDQCATFANLQPVSAQIGAIRGKIEDVLSDSGFRLERYQYIFHLAGTSFVPASVADPFADFQSTVVNTLQLLESLRRCQDPPKLILASSAAVYGTPVRLPIREEDSTVPISPYGVAKLAAERYASVYSRLFGIPVTSLRLFSVYGPRQRKQVVYDVLRKVRLGAEKIEVIGDGSQKRDFLYVLDAVDALVLAAKAAPGKGEAYNVASGTAYSIREVIEQLYKTCGRHPESVFSGVQRPGDPAEWAADIGRMASLGFQAKVSLTDGLLLVREWFDETSR